MNGENGKKEIRDAENMGYFKNVHREVELLGCCD